METQASDTLSHEIDSINFPYSREVVDFFNYLIKAVKAKLVYPSSSKLPDQFKNDLAQKAIDLFKDVETIDFKITANSIMYGRTTVYESSTKTENFAHVFFRDGLIGLSFHSGLSEDEIGRFIDLLSKMFRTVYVDDDFATLLWEENFQYITYVLIDDGLDIDTVEYSTDKLKDRSALSSDDIQSLYFDEGEITFDNDDFTVSDQDSDIRKRGQAFAQMPEATYDFLNRISEFTPAEDEEIAAIVAEDSQFDHSEYLLTVIFEILGTEKEVPGYVETLKFIGKVRDNFISLGDFFGAAALLKRMKELNDVLKNLKSPRAEKIEGFFLECASKEKIEFITESLNNLKEINSEGLVNYLNQLPWAAIDPLLISLGDLKYFKSRRAVCSVLADIGKDQIDLVARGLDDERWYVVRNVVQVLGMIGSQRVINHLKKTIRHPDYRVRKETLNAAANINSSESEDFMILALSDPDTKIQLSSLKFLTDKKCGRAFKALENLINDKKFKDRPPEQIRNFLEGYATLGQEKALPYLKPMASKRLFFATSKDERMKLFAIGALGKINSGEAQKIISKLSQSKNRKIAAAAMRSLKR